MIGFILTAMVLGIAYYWFTKRGPTNLPPGPTNWFGVGGVLAVATAHPVSTHLSFANLAKKYGDVMFVKLGVNNAVMFSTYEDIVELFKKDAFHGRYDFAFAKDRAFLRDLGILFTSDRAWLDIRRFTDKGMRKFGFGVSRLMEAAIREPLDSFIDDITYKCVKDGFEVINVDNPFTFPILCTLWKFIFGSRTKLNEVKLRALLVENLKTPRALCHENINHAFPILRHIAPGLTGHTEDLKTFHTQQRIVKELLKETDPNEDNFVKLFMEKIMETPENSEVEFSEEQLIMVIIDIFLAASETAGIAISFAILYMLVEPEKYQKLVKELEDAMPGKEIPAAADSEKMPYTRAFIHEVLRYCVVVPIPLPRKLMSEVNFKGYDIPKGTCAMYNLHCVFHDKAYWGDPEVFRPERFIDPVTQKLTRTERVIAFGTGRRMCIAETFTMDAAFAYITTLLRKFTIERVPGEGPLDLRTKGSLTLSPMPFNILLKLRE